MTVNTIKIDEVEYVRKTEAGNPTPAQIIVADRGWVFVGYVTDTDDGVTIVDAKCIRVWGTDSGKPGLGWLALNGPTDKTRLDACGTVRVPRHSVVASFDVRDSSWV